MNGISMMVGQNPYSDMPWIDDALLQKYIGAAKGFGGFGNHPLVISLQFIGIVTPLDTMRWIILSGTRNEELTAINEII